MNISEHLSTTAKLTILILLIAIFEGSVRKWISQDIGTLLIIIRDLIVILTIIISVFENTSILKNPIVKILFLWCFFVIIWGLLQSLINQTPFILMIVGFRFWLLYLIFSVFVGLSLNNYEIDKIVKILFTIAIVVVPLVLLQFSLPPDSFINKQVDNDTESIFKLTEDIVRTTGTFSFTVGQANFIALLTPLTLGYLSSGFIHGEKSKLPLWATLAVFICVILSGSRGVILLFSFIFLLYIIFNFFLSRKKLSNNDIVVLFALFIGSSCAPIIFSKAFDATSERFDNAAEVEVFSDRILSTFIGEPYVLERVSFLGEGLGLGSNFSSFVLKGENGFTLAETEPGRNLLEGGFLGFIFIGLKWFLLFVCSWQSVRIYLSCSNVINILLCFSTYIALLTSSVTSQLTSNVLGFFILLFYIAKANTDTGISERDE